MKDINSAFLQKLGWNILNHPDHLWVQILKAKYFPRNSFLQSHSKPGASKFGRGLVRYLISSNSTFATVPVMVVLSTSAKTLGSLCSLVFNPSGFQMPRIYRALALLFQIIRRHYNKKF